MNYTDKAQVEAFMGKSVPATVTDPIFETWNAAVSRFIDNVTGRSFDTSGDFETRLFNGNGKSRIYIDDAYEIQSITIDGVAQDISAFATFPANSFPIDYIEIDNFYPPNSRSLIAKDYYNFGRGLKNVAIEAKWGYAAEVPADIQLAATQLLAALVSKAGEATETGKVIQSERIGDYTVTYANLSSLSGTMGANDILSLYKKDRKGMVRTGYTAV